MKHSISITLIVLSLFLFFICGCNEKDTQAPTINQDTQAPTAPEKMTHYVFGEKVNGVQIGIAQNPETSKNSIVFNCVIRSESPLLINPSSLSNAISIYDANDTVIRPERFALIDPTTDNPADYRRINEEFNTTIAITYDTNNLNHNSLLYKIPNDRIIKFKCVLIGGFFGDAISPDQIWLGTAHSPVIMVKVPDTAE